VSVVSLCDLSTSETLVVFLFSGRHNVVTRVVVRTGQRVPLVGIETL